MLNAILQFGKAFGFGGGNGNDFHVGETLPQRDKIFFGPRQVHFVGDDAPRPLGKSRIEEVDLAPKILKIFNRMAALAAGDIKDKEEQTATGNVPEKVVPEPDVAMSAFNQTRDVRD